MTRLAVLAMLALSACGVDGPPVRVPLDRPGDRPGVSVTGDARVGVTARL